MAVVNTAQFIVSILVALLVGIAIGRIWEVARNAWNAWRGAKAALPKLRANAFQQAGNLVARAGLVALVLVALSIAAFASGQS